MNVVCFSHTLDNVGNHLVIPTLVEFGILWIRMFRHSCKAKLLWKDVTGQTPRSYSETRWWSKWGVSSVWRCRKVRRRGKGPKSLPRATATTSSNTFWLTVTNELEAWACRHYWCWRTFCESHVFFGRGWSFGFCLLWEIKRCFLILSSSLFPKRPCNCYCSFRGIPRSERNSTWTECEGLCWAGNYVVLMSIVMM